MQNTVNKTILVQSHITTLVQEMRYTDSTMLPSIHDHMWHDQSAIVVI